MNQILIKALTELGKKALAQHYAESKKMGMKEKLAFKMIGSQEFTNEDTITLNIKQGRLTQNPFFIDSIQFEIKKALSENGAKYGIDFILENK
jgi:hypothetical protein